MYHFVSNKTKNPKKFCVFRSVVCVDSYIIDTSEITNPKMSHDEHYSGLVLHTIYTRFAHSLPVEMCVRTSQSDSSPQILTHTLYSTPRSQRKHHVDCNTIFRGRVSNLSSKCFHQNSLSDTRFEAEASPHIPPAMDIHVFWRSPRTGTKCITSSASEKL